MYNVKCMTSPTRARLPHDVRLDLAGGLKICYLIGVSAQSGAGHRVFFTWNTLGDKITAGS